MNFMLHRITSMCVEEKEEEEEVGINIKSTSTSFWYITTLCVEVPNICIRICNNKYICM